MSEFAKAEADKSRARRTQRANRTGTTRGL